MPIRKPHQFQSALLLSAVCVAFAVSADETCNSPYMSGLIKGQEDFIHVWTLGEKGLGDESDKLVTVDANPASPTYGKVIGSVATGGRGEAHHMGFTDDRKYLWAGGLDDSKIFVFDVGSEPGKPRLVRTIADLPEKSGYIGPHTFYALPGRMLIGNLSNGKDKGGVTGLALYNNKGAFIQKYDMPTGMVGGVQGDGYGYDIAVNPSKNVVLTSSFAGWNNYMRSLGELVKDAEAMKHFGSTMVVWDLKSMQPTQVLSVPGAPLEIRWALAPGQNWAITAAALTSKLWLVRQDSKGQWSAKEVGTIGDPAKIPLPVDISITADGKGLWVNTFMDGITHYFDLSDPEHPKETYQKHTGRQINMISQSWDGTRVYITSSLLSKWDKAGDDNEQTLRGYRCDGRELKSAFEVDFTKEKLGRPHHMKFTARPAGRVAMLGAGSSVLSLRAAAAVAVVAFACASVMAAVDPGKATAPSMEFVPPVPGTYRLEKIQPIAEATLLDPAGRPTPLSTVTTSKITLLTFFYTYCVDPLGCPFAYVTLTDIRNRLLSDAVVARQVRFVGISLDPTNDTPEAIGRYRDGLSGGSGFEWQVLTAPSVRDLLPVLSDLGQDVSVETAADGTERRTLHHMLKVFLVDRRGTVREIYSLAYLHPTVIVNDIRTLAMERG